MGHQCHVCKGNIQAKQKSFLLRNDHTTHYQHAMVEDCLYALRKKVDEQEKDIQHLKEQLDVNK